MFNDGFHKQFFKLLVPTQIIFCRCYYFHLLVKITFLITKHHDDYEALTIIISYLLKEKNAIKYFISSFRVICKPYKHVRDFFVGNYYSCFYCKYNISFALLFKIR